MFVRSISHTGKVCWFMPVANWLCRLTHSHARRTFSGTWGRSCLLSSLFSILLLSPPLSLSLSFSHISLPPFCRQKCQHVLLVCHPPPTLLVSSSLMDRRRKEMGGASVQCSGWARCPVFVKSVRACVVRVRYLCVCCCLSVCVCVRLSDDYKYWHEMDKWPILWLYTCSSLCVCLHAFTKLTMHTRGMTLRSVFLWKVYRYRLTFGTDISRRTIKEDRFAPLTLLFSWPVMPQTQWNTLRSNRRDNLIFYDLNYWTTKKLMIIPPPPREFMG